MMIVDRTRADSFVKILPDSANYFGRFNHHNPKQAQKIRFIFTCLLKLNFLESSNLKPIRSNTDFKYFCSHYNRNV